MPQVKCLEAAQQHTQNQEETTLAPTADSAMSSTSDNEISFTSIIVDAEQEPLGSLESPPSDRMIKTDLHETMESPTMVQDFDDMISDIGSTSSYDLGIDEEDDSHHSLQEMITESLGRIEVVMGDILNEKPSSSRFRRRLMKRNSSRDTVTDDYDILPPPMSLRTCSSMGSDDLDLDGLQKELVSCFYEQDVIYTHTLCRNSQCHSLFCIPDKR